MALQYVHKCLKVILIVSVPMLLRPIKPPEWIVCPTKIPEICRFCTELIVSLPSFVLKLHMVDKYLTSLAYTRTCLMEELAENTLDNIQKKELELILHISCRNKDFPGCIMLICLFQLVGAFYNWL